MQRLADLTTAAVTTVRAADFACASQKICFIAASHIACHDRTSCRCSCCCRCAVAVVVVVVVSLLQGSLRTSSYRSH
jgi:hypothetical protein